MALVILGKTRRRGDAAIQVIATGFARPSDAELGRGRAGRIARAFHAAERGIALPGGSALVGSVGSAKRTGSGGVTAAGEDGGAIHQENPCKNAKNHGYLHEGKQRAAAMCVAILL
jgi:hypothetical protein